MFEGFFLALRAAQVPVSLREYLSLLDALQAGVVAFDVEDFYFLARATLVKDERHIDRFDQVFARHFKGLETVSGEVSGTVPAEWLKALAERYLTPEERAKLQAMDWDTLMATLQQRLEEQRGRHQGGSKWIGTGGTSPFGAYGENPAGVRIGQHESRHRRAVKVWDRREFRNYDGDAELGRRQIKIALRRLRQFARVGEPTELDMAGTVRSTAAHAGLLDLQLVPERRNAIKVLLLLDVGGSMDDHVLLVQELFAGARAAFKHLETYYFHNCPYERLWRDNRRRAATTVDTHAVINTYNADWRLVLVGDATMSPYEITETGGSVEHWNPEPGAVWMRRLLAAFPKAVWINPKPEAFWSYTPSLALLRQLMAGRMAPMTLDGLDRAVRLLRK